MASNLQAFTDFMDATENTILTSPGHVLNEATANSYLLREYLRGKSESEVVQGGKKIQDFIMFDEASTFDHVLPGQTHVWKNPQVLDSWETSWRYAIDHMTWTDQEIELQMGDGLSTDGRHRVLKRLKQVKEMRVKTSLINGLEDELWRLPSGAEMEADAGRHPYSLVSHFNENTDGLHENWGSSTKQNISPTAEAKWVPQQVGYDFSGATPTITGEAILDAFDTMFYRVGRDSLPMGEEVSESPTNATMIVCSAFGINQYKQALRRAQDSYVTPDRQDPAYNNPKYSGISLVYASGLDDARLWVDGGIGVGSETGSGVTNDGPRYLWINRKYHKPVFHSKRYMYRGQTMRHPNQPSTHIQTVDCWHNYPAQSMQRHGIVFPNA